MTTLINRLKPYYKSLPAPFQKVARFVFGIREYIPFTRAFERRLWIKNEYFKFGQDERRRIFLSIARFCHINRPIEGYYFEFGCHEANTMRMAYDCSKHLFNWDYVAFDSFEGLPEISEIDKQEIWKQGKLKTAEEDFRQILAKHGMPASKLTTVKGFYNQSLTSELRDRLLPKKAAVIYVDCDLYQSTVDVLKFSKDFLQRGTIVVFDDWNCFHADPQKGERRAFSEFLAANPDLQFEEFVSTNEAKAFVFLGSRQNP